MTVALIEAGGSDLYHWVHIPVGYVYTMRYPQHRTNWGFATSSQEGLGGREIFYPRGKVLGGSGSINGMSFKSRLSQKSARTCRLEDRIAMRGQPEDYDAWAAMVGDEGWSWEQLRPHFERLVNYTAGPPVLPDGTALGTGGPLEVTKQVTSWAILDEWALACERFGLQKRSHFIDSSKEGVGYFEVTQTHARSGRGGVRLSPYRAFVAPIRDRRPNLTIFTNLHARKVSLEREADSLRATGVELWLRAPRDGWFDYLRAVLVDLGLITGRPDKVAQKQRDVPCSIRARREVVLACGAISSPHLLQCSGIGDPKLLKKASVEPIVDLPGVGKNLQDHLQIRAVFRLHESVDTLNSRMASWWGIVRTGLEYILWQTGPMAMAPSQLGVFAKYSAALETPDLQWHARLAPRQK